MGLAPSKPVDRAAFYKEKTSTTGPFKVNAVAIGTTTLAVDALNAAAVATLDAWQEQLAKKAAAKTATQNFKQLAATMSTMGSDVIAAIRAKAAVSGPSTWTLADLPEPSTPTPVGPPGTPENFRAELVQSGAVKLGWKCQNPKNGGGTLYQIARKIGAGAGGATILGATGKKTFTDATVPAGSDQVTYEITAIRSTAVGLPGLFTVRFGVGGAGEMTATVVSGGAGPNAPKLAA